MTSSRTRRSGRRFQSTPAPIGAGDRHAATRLGRYPVFQSTPAPIGAGDRRTRWVSDRHRSFNPRPPRSERATLDSGVLGLDVLVSIHARPDRSGRPADPLRRPHSLQGFNPRPPRSERATCTSKRTQSEDKVSIHARPDRSGRQERHVCFSSVEDVSIHARPDRSGRRVVFRLSLFRSAVSIHARPDRSGRRPSRRAARTHPCFNPRPPRSERATFVYSARHAKLRFQSTPAPIGAGDASRAPC